MIYSFKNLIIGIFVHIMFIQPGYSNNNILLMDDLSDQKTKGEFKNGELTENGWKSAGGALTFKVGKLVSKGGVAVWITNWNPQKQATASKYHIFETRSNSKAGKTNADWAAFRVGFSNYVHGFKILSMPEGIDSHSKKEKRCDQNNPKDASKVYRMKITYDNGVVRFYWDDKLWASHDWAKKGHPMEFSDFALGKGWYNYGGVNGTIFKKVLAWEGEEPQNMNALTEGGTVILSLDNNNQKKFISEYLLKNKSFGVNGTIVNQKIHGQYIISTN